MKLQATFHVLAAFVATSLAITTVADVKNDLYTFAAQVQTLSADINNFPQSGGSLGAVLVYLTLWQTGSYNLI